MPHPLVADPCGHEPAGVRPADRVTGNVLSGALADLLASFGVASTADRDAVTEAIERELQERGHCARVVRLRYGTLHLEASAQVARFLRYDIDDLVAALAVCVPGEVTSIVVQVAAS